jgi:hypothetical protein
MKIEDNVEIHIQIDNLILSEDTNELVSCIILDIIGEDYTAIPWIPECAISYKNLYPNKDPLFKRLFVLGENYFNYDFSHNCYFSYDNARIDLDADFFTNGAYTYTKKKTVDHRTSKTKESIFDITRYKGDKVRLKGKIIYSEIETADFSADLYSIIIELNQFELRLKAQINKK